MQKCALKYFKDKQKNAQKKPNCFPINTFNINLM